MIYLGIVSMIVAMGVTSVLTPSVIRLAHRLGAMDLPGGRKIHGGPIPRIGGVAVYFGFVAGLASAAFLAGFLLEPMQVHVYWPGLVIAATVIFLVGLADDLWRLRYYWKFAAQIACAVLRLVQRLPHRHHVTRRRAGTRSGGVAGDHGPVDRRHHQRGQPDRRPRRSRRRHRADHDAGHGGHRLQDGQSRSRRSLCRAGRQPARFLALQLQPGADLPRRLGQHVPRLRAGRGLGAREPEAPDGRRRAGSVAGAGAAPDRYGAWRSSAACTA